MLPFFLIICISLHRAMMESFTLEFDTRSIPEDDSTTHCHKHQRRPRRDRDDVIKLRDRIMKMSIFPSLNQIVLYSITHKVSAITVKHVPYISAYWLLYHLKPGLCSNCLVKVATLYYWQQRARVFSAPIDQPVNDTGKVKVMDWIPKETHTNKTYMSLYIIQFCK